MDLKTVEIIEREDPSEETLTLTTRRRELMKPGGYQYIQGQWKRYNPPRTLKAEQKKIEVEPRRNKRLLQRMKGTNKESQDEIERKRDYHRVINNIRNLQKT